MFWIWCPREAFPQGGYPFMSTRRAIAFLALSILAATGGCRSSQSKFVAADAVTPTPSEVAEEIAAPESVVTPAQFNEEEVATEIVEPLPASAALPKIEQPAEIVGAEATLVAAPSVNEVVRSVVEFFPVIQQATAGRQIAYGEVLAASGAFDHKLDITADSQPLDFYQNHRSGIGVKRETTWGGRTFAGYRIGRGVYEPWYQERETNKGGEFKVGFTAPIIRDRVIDANRSELWQAQVEQSRVEAEIDTAVIRAARDGASAYWAWLAAIAKLEIAEEVLQLGVDRREFLEKQIAAGEKRDIDRVDNRRIIVSREAKVVDARRKVRQAASKLSLYLRDQAGRPVVVETERPDASFEEVGDPSGIDSSDVAFAQSNRPELRELQLVSRQIGIAISQACNETWPDVDAGLLVAQDVGERTSSKGDKSEFELEASLTISVPLERRKAFGKLRQLRGKLAQVRAKQRFTNDKIAIEVQVARAALEAAAQRVAQTTEGYQLAQRMNEAERTLYEAGQSSLFNLNIREKQSAEAALEVVDAKLDYHLAAADYAAALGLSQPEIDAGEALSVPARVNER